MNNLYFYLNLAVLSVPAALSFDKKVYYFRRWAAVLTSAAAVGIPYLVWDFFATARGDWGFSEKYAGVFRVAGLPVGEILFFFAVPFSCIFLFEVAGAYIPDKRSRVYRLPVWAASVAAGAAAMIFRENAYTTRVFVSVAIFLFAASWTDLLGRLQFWIHMGISMVAFFGVNTVLTAVPVVVYGPGAVIGVRIITIPLEDFFYNFSLLGFNVLVYSLLRGRIRGHA
jgi:lycopene cyclase domain-containing protein